MDGPENGTDLPAAAAVKPKKKSKWDWPIVQIHHHFTMFRSIHDPKEGPVTLDEQINELRRATRWHQRQVEVNEKTIEELTAKLAKQE